jgi:hypothetical protein
LTKPHLIAEFAIKRNILPILCIGIRRAKTSNGFGLAEPAKVAQIVGGFEGASAGVCQNEDSIIIVSWLILNAVLVCLLSERKTKV